MPTLTFVIDRSIGPVSPVGGTSATYEGPVFELRTIPGGLIGCGKSPAEAAKNLHTLLLWTLTTEQAPDKWYLRAWDRASLHDHEKFAKRMLAHYAKLEPTRSATPVQGKAVEYATLEPIAC